MSRTFIKPNKKIEYFIYAFTLVVYELVTVLHYLPKADSVPFFATALPTLNVMINGTCAIILIASLIAIKNNKVVLHQRLNTTAMILSVIFLLSYVTYHYFSGDTKYQGNYIGL